MIAYRNTLLNAGNRLTGLNSPSKKGCKNVSNVSPVTPSRSSAYGNTCTTVAYLTSGASCTVTMSPSLNRKFLRVTCMCVNIWVTLY